VTNPGDATNYGRVFAEFPRHMHDPDRPGDYIVVETEEEKQQALDDGYVLQPPVVAVPHEVRRARMTPKERQQVENEAAVAAAKAITDANAANQASGDAPFDGGFAKNPVKKAKA
jgi:hypothetical protein